MPESEPKPKLIELVAPGAGQGWKAVLKNGKAAVVHEINAPAAEAAAAVPRIQRLADHRHPALAPVLAWGTEANGLWVAVEPNEGVPLGTILSRGELERQIYGWNEEVESNAIEFLIHAIRKKLGAAAIRNVRGVGWMVDRPS